MISHRQFSCARIDSFRVRGFPLHSKGYIHKMHNPRSPRLESTKNEVGLARLFPYRLRTGLMAGMKSCLLCSSLPSQCLVRVRSQGQRACCSGTLRPRRCTTSAAQVTCTCADVLPAASDTLEVRDACDPGVDSEMLGIVEVVTSLLPFGTSYGAHSFFREVTFERCVVQPPRKT